MIIELEINEVKGNNSLKINWINLYKLCTNYDFEIIQKIINFTKDISKTYYFLQPNEVINLEEFKYNNKKLLKYLDEENIAYKFVDNQICNTLIGDTIRFYDDNLDSILSINNILKKINIQKKFLCLNGAPNNHRALIYNFLINSGISNDTFLSYNSSDSTLENHLTIEGDTYNDYDNNIKINPFYYKSFCNIVTETDFSNGMIHITEKTDKSLFSLQPFIIVGNPYSLKRLKELGFKTFDKWWDESYDNYKDGNQRMGMIKKTIKYVSKFSLNDCKRIHHEMLGILIHNQKLAINYGKKNINKYHPNKRIGLNLDNGKIINL